MKLKCAWCPRDILGAARSNEQMRDKRYEARANFHEECYLAWKAEAPKRRQQFEMTRRQLKLMQGGKD